MTAGRLVIPLVVGGILLMGGSAGAARRAVPHWTATGKVTALNHSQIHVGHWDCKVGPKGFALTGGFSIGERVTISCLGGVLRAIKQALIAAGASGTSGQPGSSSSVTTTTSVGGSSSVTSSSTSTSTGGNSSAHNFSIAWATGDTSGGSTVTASGQVTALDSSGITIAGVTCAFPSGPFASSGGLFKVVSASVNVGDSATLTCTTASGGSSGKITSV